MGYSEQVETLLRQGAQFLGEKDYEKAVEAFGDACAKSQEETNEIDPDLFFLYGKALYESGVSTSDVLGGQQITNEKLEESKPEDNDGNFQFNDLAAEAEDDDDEEDDDDADDADEQAAEEDDEEEKNDNEQEEEDDDENKLDMELAWDILEIARNHYQERVDKLDKSSFTVPYLKSDKEEPSDAYVKALKALSETYDLLGEISLESEHFIQAASDLEQCLKLRTQLYDSKTSSLVGESHFKLSLALEFCLEDDDAKNKARSHISAAIEILNHNSELHPEKKQDNDEIVQSLKERYDEIDGSAEDAINKQKEAIMEGILGKSSGSGAGVELLSQALTAKPVNDLSQMVKKRKPKPLDSTNKRSKN